MNIKKIIDGKKYNTETGTQLAIRENGNSRDWAYIHEELYKSPKGTYFLAYEGGPLSKYGIDVGNRQTSGSDGILLLSIEEAEDFMKNHAELEEYEREFGKVKEG